MLDVPELLEAILFNLPMRNLLLSQRVSKHWKATIEASTKLQRALFFKPAVESPVSWVDWRLEHRGWYSKADIKLAFGPVQQDLPLEKRPAPYVTHWGKDRGDEGRYQVFVNPLLAEIFPVLTGTGIHNPGEDIFLPTPIHEPLASWRKMYFTQPTVETLAVSCFSRESDMFSGWSTTECVAVDGSHDFVFAALEFFLDTRTEPSWIEGRGMWKQWESGMDLAKITNEQG